MGTAFATALDTLHTDENLSVAGTYTPVGGSPASVRVIISQKDQPAGPFGIQGQVPSLTASLRLSEVATRPTENARIVVSAGPHAATYRVLSAELDNEGLSWGCGVERAS